ncbi:LysR family transcriptional regulator [Acidocella sp.]|uniref:LysR family transcriptional regulator n=1 Tax=Acidocella sp. TaxID=50710 RepID=UPI002608B6EB|nr:LysR family transcriptional regulator [Acidocella sp.]
MKIDAKYLIQISAIIETGTFQAAATMLGLTQPALSRNIRMVEERIGQPIFLKSGRKAQPTDLGMRLAQEGLAIKRAQDAASLYLTSIKSGSVDRLRVGAPPGIARHLVCPAISLFIADHPEILIDISIGNSKELAEKLADGRTDLVIGPLSAVDQWPGMKISKLFDDRIGILCRKNHPLTRQAVITPHDLTKYKWLQHPNGTPIRLQTDAAFSILGLQDIQWVLPPDNASFIFPLISNCDLLSTMPRWPLFYTQAFSLDFLDFDHPALSRSINVIRRRNSDLSKIHNILLKKIKIIFSNMQDAKPASI